MKLNVNKVEFIKSAASPAAFIRDGRPQVAFAGKSNSGKSSVINCILNRKRFARISATPGKTAHVNYFLVDQRLYFTDLPGYGFAKVPDAEKKRWGELMEAFFSEDRVRLGVIILDIRRDPSRDDRTMADCFERLNCPYLVLANKCDKLSPTAGEKRMIEIREALQLADTVPVIRFSAEKGEGRAVLLSAIESIG